MPASCIPTNYLIPIGPCDLRIAQLTGWVPWLPDRMARTGDSVIARRWVPTRWMPKWEEDPNRGNGARAHLVKGLLPALGKVIQKKLNPTTFNKHLRDGINQNVAPAAAGRIIRAAQRAAQK